MNVTVAASISTFDRTAVAAQGRPGLTFSQASSIYYVSTNPVSIHQHPFLRSAAWACNKEQASHPTISRTTSSHQRLSRFAHHRCMSTPSPSSYPRMPDVSRGRQSYTTTITSPTTSFEGRRGLRTTRENQFTVKHGRKHHDYPAAKAPYALSYDKDILDRCATFARGAICFRA